VDALRDLLDLMENFESNDERARYLMSSEWMRVKHPPHPITDTIRDIANTRLSQLLRPIAHPSPRPPWSSTSKTPSRALCQ